VNGRKCNQTFNEKKKDSISIEAEKVLCSSPVTFFRQISFREEIFASQLEKDQFFAAAASEPKNS
jgi:hypothetical protein